MIRPPSSIVGTTPLGFMSRYHFWSLPPNCSPTFSRSYFNPHSSAHHSTFMTLIELARPQIFIPASPWVGPDCSENCHPERSEGFMPGPHRTLSSGLHGCRRSIGLMRGGPGCADAGVDDQWHR